VADAGTLVRIDPDRITRNPNNPRRFFNDERLDLLRTSIQEVGILVPLIVYPEANHYVLMDGERRWLSARELGLDSVPINVIQAPTPLENLLRMFNIHAVRDDWPLVSVALSLGEVSRLANESRESRLAEMTGLTRSTVRRAKRLLTLPARELELIQSEAHLDRSQQIHREDLYLEIQAAESLIRNQFPELGEKYRRSHIIRQFARKREGSYLRAVTEFRDISKLVKTVEDKLVSREKAVAAIRDLIEHDEVTPSAVFQKVAAAAFEQQELARRIQLLTDRLQTLESGGRFGARVRTALRKLIAEAERVLGERE
jgi:ParB family transcriptional regulator, chromosome partitioning protein